MSDRDNIDRYRDEALAWVVRLIPGNATKADVDAFERWSAQNPAHAQAFVEARSLWEASASAGRNVLARNGAEALSLQVDRNRIARRAFFAGGAVAAGVAATYFLVRPPFDLWPPVLDVLEADYRTDKGEQKRLMLADVSIEMNTETSVALRPGGEVTNRIELLSGEGAFITGAQPFDVMAANGHAWATKTNFTVRRDGETVFVTCTTGSVRVQCGRATASLAAQQQLSYSNQGMSGITAVDPEIVTAWQRGFLVFHDSPLSKVITEINRYRPGRIILVNAELGQRLVNARFRLDRIDDVVTKVTNAFGAKATSLPGGLIILS